jgi:uncharacterized membrane protein
MKLSAGFKKIMASKMALNIVFLIFLLNVLGNILIGRFEHILYFALIGGLMSYFSKNLIVVLLSTLIIVNFLIVGKVVREGMDTDLMTEEEKQAFVQEQLEITKNKMEEKNEGEKKTVKSGNLKSYDKKKKKPSIDYASTVETAYKDLNGVLGSDGMKNLTTDTKNLVDQQKQLAEAMQGMAPLINNFGPLMDQATAMMKTMGNTGGLANLTKMVK